MIKVKAYELSKGFGIPSKEIVKVLHDYEVSTKNHMSALDENELNVIFEYFTQKNQVEDFSALFAKKEEPVEKKEKKKSAKKASTENVSAEEISFDNTEGEESFSSDSGSARKIRVVDTRANAVDLDRLDNEKLEELIPENIKADSSSNVQKIKGG